MPLSQYFRLIDVMARMALRADATKFFLGYVWWVLEPLLYVAVFYVVFNMILTSRQPDFLLFLMTGKLAFVWFSKSVTRGTAKFQKKSWMSFSMKSSGERTRKPVCHWRHSTSFPRSVIQIRMRLSLSRTNSPSSRRFKAMPL